MKRIYIIAFTLSFIFFIITGCFKEKDNEKEEKIDVYKEKLSIKNE